MKQKLQSFIKKGNNTKAKLFIAFFISIISAIIIAKLRIITYGVNLENVFLLTAGIYFILLHFIINLKVMYEWIDKKRFLIALIILLYVTIMGYSGSSIGKYDYYVQPQSTNESFLPILGRARAIRSDEWAVKTPIWYSQVNDKDSAFAYYNDNLRGTKTDMFSIVNAPVKNILTIAKPFQIMFLLAGFERGMSFLWYGKLIALFLLSYEFCKILTNKNKPIALLGTILITFSSAMQFWDTIEYAIFGLLALICINKFMLTRKTKIKLLCALGIFFAGIGYIFVFYPAWQIPFGWICLACIIWLWVKNKYKLNIKDFFIILGVLVAICIVVVTYFYFSKEALEITMNTSYPGNRVSLGGKGAFTLFSYVYSIIFIKSQGNVSELSGMTSFYPIPLIISILYVIKSKNRRQHLAFYIPTILLSIIFSIFTIMPTNKIFSQITLLYMSTGNRLAVPLGFLQIFMLLYTMANIKEEEQLLGDASSKIIAILLSEAIFYTAINTMQFITISLKVKCICYFILLFETYFILTIHKQKSKKYFIFLVIPVMLINGVLANPVQKGADVLSEKPIAKKVQEIVAKDSKNNLWITDNLDFIFSNYVLANGAKVINSTHTYPDLELYKKILGEEAENKEIKDIYNRYSHIIIEIVTEKSRVELFAPDAVKIYLNANMVKELNINYIVTKRNLEEFNTQEIEFEKIYDEYDLLIYKVN